jgi:transforming growth factor-beta-induced protein
VVENYSSLGAGEARVTAFHGIEGLPPVDVVASGNTIVDLLAFPGTLGGNDGAFDVTVPAGVYNLQVVVTRALAADAAAPNQVLFDLPETRLDPGVHYFVAAVGTPAEPQLVLVPFTMPGASTQSLIDLAASNTRLSTFAAAVEAAGLTEELATGGPYTVFAPNDAAFAAALDALGVTPEAALANPELLTPVLLYHVVPGALSVDALVARGSVTTLEGSALEFEAADFGALINGSVQIVRPDAAANNGVLHTVNSVLLPPALAQMVANATSTEEAATEEETTAEAEAPAEEQQTAVEPVPQGDTVLDIIGGDSRLGTLLAAAQVVDLPGTLGNLGPVTILAPNDAAFDAALASLNLTLEDVVGQPDLLRQILFYHVIPGGYSAADLIAAGRVPTLEGNAVEFRTSSATSDFGAVINRFARILRPDRLAADGSYVHTIDSVLLPPSVAASLGVTQDPGDTIAEVAAANGSFNTLLAALGAAGLADTFNDPLAGPFTVFAPTDDAFAAALATLGVSAEDLLADTEMLTGILQYHVVSGRVPAEEVVTLESATTLQGSDIAIAVQDGNVVLNDSVNVVLTNVQASNGIIHVIDGVLLPPAAEE